MVTGESRPGRRREDSVVTGKGTAPGVLSAAVRIGRPLCRNSMLVVLLPGIRPLRRSSMLLLLWLGIATGCAHGPRSYTAAEHRVSPGEGMAVLPPTNLTESERAQRVIHEALMVEVLRMKTVRVVDPGLVRGAMREARVWSADLLERSQMEALSSLLGARYLLLGSIHEFGILEKEQGKIPVVSIHLRLVDTDSGDIIWAAVHTQEGDDGESIFGLGRVDSVDRLAEIVVQDTVAKLRGLFAGY